MENVKHINTEDREDISMENALMLFRKLTMEQKEEVIFALQTISSRQ